MIPNTLEIKMELDKNIHLASRIFLEIFMIHLFETLLYN